MFMFPILNEIWKFFFPPKKLTEGLAKTVVDAKPASHKAAPENMPATLPVAPHHAAHKFGKMMKEKE
jgi:hypothetical protein